MRSILFVEQTENGELAKRLRDLVLRMAPTMGFSVKVVERTGTTLRNKLPQSNLWEGAPCGRDDCTTCLQESERQVPCTRRSLVYENVCKKCNKGAGGKEEVKVENPEIPSIYVGETSRTIKERSKEHWGAFKGGKKAKEGSHIYKHQEIYHPGEEPNFVMRDVEFFKTALSRQTAEAVRIHRRGGAGAVLNSKSEYNRSYIPRLKVVEEEVVKEIEANEKQMDNEIREELMLLDNNWEKEKSTSRSKNIKSNWIPTATQVKRSTQAPGSTARRSKKMKYAILHNWGEEDEQTKTTENKNNQEPMDPLQEGAEMRSLDRDTRDTPSMSRMSPATGVSLTSLVGGHPPCTPARSTVQPTILSYYQCREGGEG